MSDASKITGYKDMTVGAVKETLGSATGNQKLELTGKAQKVHGKNEVEYAKAYIAGQTEPEKFAKAYHIHDTENCSEEDPSKLSGLTDQLVGGIKSGVASVTGNQKMELIGKAQSAHGRNEAEFAKAHKDGLDEPEDYIKPVESAEGSVEGDKVSSMSAMKDRVVGGIKQSVGSITGNQKTELSGMAQKVHGRNEAEFAKAEKKGLDEPEHFAHGTKTTDHADGSVEDKCSSISALGDRAMGGIKESLGSVTGNQKMELLGKAQSVHGRNEAEFAKCHKDGLNEPKDFIKPVEPATGSVQEEKYSAVSSLADRAVGAVKETVGSATGNQKMELLGKAQQVHARNEAELAKAETPNA